MFTTRRHTALALAAVTFLALPAAASDDRGDTWDGAVEEYNGSVERLNNAWDALTE